jgi:outer membrane biosynthesis protein TonB
MMSSSAFSNFLRDLPETLQQPAALAMLGSMGVHLILFATLPAFTSSPDPVQSEIRRVRLVEPQGSSAPQTSTSRLGLPPIPSTPNSKIQLPQTGQTTSPIPNPLYTLPDLTPLPIPASPLPQRRNLGRSLTQEEINAIRERIRKFQALQQPQTPPQTQPTTPPANPAPTNPQSPTQGLTPANPADVARGTTPAPPGTPSPTGQPQPTTPPAPVPQTRTDQLLALTRYNPQGTTAQDIAVSSQTFTQSLKDKGVAWERIVLRKPEDPIQEVPFPDGFVLQNYQERQHPAAIAVLVDKDGKLLDKPQILASTGYGILNQKAEEIVKANATPAKVVELIQKYEAAKAEKDRNKAQAYLLVYELKFKVPNGSTASVTPSR